MEYLPKWQYFQTIHSTLNRRDFLVDFVNFVFEYKKNADSKRDFQRALADSPAVPRSTISNFSKISSVAVEDALAIADAIRAALLMLADEEFHS